MTDVESTIYKQKKKISIERKTLRILKILKAIGNEVRSNELHFEEGARLIKSEIDKIISISKQIEGKK